MDRAKGTGEQVVCPVCSRQLPLERINSHIDACLNESCLDGDKKKRGSHNNHDGNRKRKKAKVDSVEDCGNVITGIPPSGSGNVRPNSSTDSSEYVKDKMLESHAEYGDQCISPKSVEVSKEKGGGLMLEDERRNNSTGNSPPIISLSSSQKTLRQSSLVLQRSPQSVDQHPHGSNSKERQVSSKSFSSSSQVGLSQKNSVQFRPSQNDKHEGSTREKGKVSSKPSSSAFNGGNLPNPSPSMCPSSKEIALNLATDFRPLAEKMRPSCIEDFVGQGNIFGTNTILKKIITSGQIPSLILWGPPGCGKTTLATIIANKMKETSNTKLVKLSATTSNVAEVKKVTTEAVNLQRMFKRKTLLFMDEIHRFNKLQQDTFLPFVENGTITLVGATTENPSFQLNSALLSRCQVIVLAKHSADDLMHILKKAAASLGVTVMKEVESNEESDGNIKIQEKALVMLANFCDGDARSALNVLEMTVKSCQDAPTSQRMGQNGPLMGSEKKSKVITVDLVKESLQRSHIFYDRTGEEHYNCISALHKSMRGCDANASLYWLGRMLVGGENPLYVARRLIEFASVDVGLADPSALVQAVSTFRACEALGMPVCEFNLAQCVVYLARAPKSPEIYLAYEKVKKCITEHEGPMPGVPLHLRNAPTKLMKNLGYGKGYNPTVRQVYMPEGLESVRFLPD